MTFRSRASNTLFSVCWRIAIRPNLKWAVVVILLMLGSAIFEMATVGLTIPLLDAITRPEGVVHNRVFMFAADTLHARGVTASTGFVTFVLLAVACLLFVAGSVFSLLHQCATAIIALRLRRQMKSQLFEGFLRARYEEVVKHARGTVVYHINEPADAIYTAILNLGQFAAGAFNCALMVGLMLCLSWWVTLGIGLLAVSGIQGWRWLTGQRAEALGRTWYDLRGAQAKIELDAIDGLKVVKAYGVEEYQLRCQRNLLAAEARPVVQLALLKHGPNLVNESIASLIILGLGAATFLFPSAGIRFPVLVALLVAIRRVSAAMTSIHVASVGLGRSRRGLDIIEQILHAIPQERRGGCCVGQVHEVRLGDISFAYGLASEQHVLSGVTATMRRGTVTAIVGPTGAGKSTLAYLLLGLYQPSSGSVTMNGIDLKHADLHAWRRRIGYVSQDSFVFNTTIRENMTLGEDVDGAELERAAHLAQLHEFIVGLPKGYETVVGDRGLRLSGGQCQRLAIARAVLRRPDLLIFDEATSALDSLTERAVYDAISASRRESIVVVIAHRLSTVRSADHILVVQAGHLVESGTHQALIDRGGLYAKLYRESDAQRTADEMICEGTAARIRAK